MNKMRKIWLAVITIVTILITGGIVVGSDSKNKDQEDRILQTLIIPPDSTRISQEAYYARHAIQLNKRKFLAAYWREGGSFLAEGVDLFEIRKTKKNYEPKRVYSGVIGGPVSSFLRFDIDGDGKKDLIILHETGGQILTKGITVLRQADRGFAEIFSYEGHDIWVYHKRSQLRIMVKEDGIGEIEEFAWNKRKKKIVVRKRMKLVQ